MRFLGKIWLFVAISLFITCEKPSEVFTGDSIEMVPDTSEVQDVHFVIWNFLNIPTGSSIGDSSLSPTFTALRPFFTPDIAGDYTLEISFYQSNGLPVLDSEGNPEVQQYSIPVLSRKIDAEEEIVSAPKDTLVELDALKITEIEKEAILQKETRDTLQKSSEYLETTQISTRPNIEKPKTPQPAKKKSAQYTFQFGAYPTYDEALKMMQELRKYGFDVYIQITNSNTHPFRVRVGRFDSVDTALPLKKDLEEVFEQEIWIDFVRED